LGKYRVRQKRLLGGIQAGAGRSNRLGNPVELGEHHDVAGRRAGNDSVEVVRKAL
jgi:hypothetical protein